MLFVLGTNQLLAIQHYFLNRKALLSHEDFLKTKILPGKYFVLHSRTQLGKPGAPQPQGSGPGGGRGHEQVRVEVDW